MSATSAATAAAAAAAPLTPPQLPLTALLAALDDDAPAAQLQPRLPRAVGHYRGIEVCVEGVIRGVLTITPRLSFITLQQTDAEAAAAAVSSGSRCAAPAARLVQVVLKLNDGTGWTAAQQAACKAQMRVGQRMALHAFVEINPPTNTPAAAAAVAAASASAGASSVAASSSSAVAAAVPLESTSSAWEVRPIAPIAAAVCDQPLGAAAVETGSSSASAGATQSSPLPPPPPPQPLPPIEARLSLHAISVVLEGPAPGAPQADATGAEDRTPSRSTGMDAQLCAHALSHSARYAAAMAAEPEAEAEAERANRPEPEPTPAPRSFPDIALALRERVEMAAAAEAKRAAAEAASAAAAASSGDGSDPGRPLSLKEQQKRLNKERQKGDPRKRAPKCNLNRGLKFFEFLSSTFGMPLLSSGSGVLDVAGGQGVVSWELSKRDLPTVVVDPRPISGAWTQRRARYLNIRKKIAQELGSRPEPTFRHLQCLFDPAFLTNESTRSVWESTPLVVGMHPDEATDSIVELSLAAGKPWAVIPCCVFPNQNPHRRTPQGEVVRTHEQLCAYYCGLHPDIRSAQLDFEGRNTVIYYAPTSRMSEAATAAAAAASTSPDAMIDELVSATAASTLSSSGAP